jgi:hypothetical protein
MKPPKAVNLTPGCLSDGLQSALERKFIEEYLARKGCSLADISSLEAEAANALMKEACMFASLKLAEIESRAHLRASIHLPER